MKEADKSICQGIGYVETDGKIVSRDILFVRDGDTYVISVSKPDYIERIIAVNSSNTDHDLDLNDNLYPLNDVSDIERICQGLSNISLDELKPYLTKQEK